MRPIGSPEQHPAKRMGLEAFTLRRGNRTPARPWLTTAALGVSLAAVAAVVVFLWPLWHRQESPVTATRELAHLQTIGQALRLHAQEHDGKFPVAITGIEWRQDQPGLERAGLPAAVGMFHDPETGREHRWLYYPDHTLADPPETILAASPFPVGKKKDRRLVVRVNAVAEIIDEEAFQKQIARQTADTPARL